MRGGRKEDMPFRDSSLVFSQCSKSLAVTVHAAAIGLAHVMSTICERFKHLGLWRQLNGKTLQGGGKEKALGAPAEPSN